MPIDDALENLEKSIVQKDEKVEDKHDDLDLLIDQLSSEKSKRNIIIMAVEKGITDKPSYVNVAYDYCLKHELYTGAGKILEKAKRYDEAFKLYTDHNLFDLAGNLALRLNQLERALTSFAKAAQSDQKYHVECGDVLKMLNKYPSAIEHYKKSGTGDGLFKAAQLLESMSIFNEAKELYFKANMHDEVNRMEQSEKYLRWQMLQQEEAGCFIGAAGTAKRLKDEKKVAVYTSLARLFNNS